MSVRLLMTGLLVAGWVMAPTFAFQARGGRGTAGPAAKACAILTRDLVEPFVTNTRVLDLFEPEEEPMPAGTACEYGVVRLQLSAGPGPKRAAPNPEWTAVGGAGEAAFFRSNRNEYAELMVWSGNYYFTLQVGVPSGSSPTAIKPQTLTLANAIIARLR